MNVNPTVFPSIGGNNKKKTKTKGTKKLLNKLKYKLSATPKLKRSTKK